MTDIPVPAAKITEREVQNALWLDLYHGHPLVCPNYTPRDWYECDVFAVTRAGYGVEFEVKLSVGDFRKDAKKSTYHIQSKVEGVGHERIARTKHSRLCEHDAKGPSRFYFVVPEGMIGASDIPEWAGLITFQGRSQGGWILLSTVKEAPRLRTTKVEVTVMHHMGKCLGYRYWHLRRRCNVVEDVTTTSDADATEVM